MATLCPVWGFRRTHPAELESQGIRKADETTRGGRGTSTHGQCGVNLNPTGGRPRRTLLIYALGGDPAAARAGSRCWARRHTQLLRTRVVAFLALRSSSERAAAAPASAPAAAAGGASVHAVSTPSLSGVGRAAAVVRPRCTSSMASSGATTAWITAMAPTAASSPATERR